MADHGRATKLTRTETVAIKHLTAITDSPDTHSRLISDEEINLRPNAMICVLLFIAFIILGIIACNTIDAIETATVGITWLLVLIGVLSGAAGAWMIYFNRNPGKGILIFLGYYIIVALIPALFITGFYMYYYGCYNTEDYLRAVKDDEEYWNQKYGEEKTVELANEKAFDAIWIQGAANVTVGMVILATLIPFGLKIKALGSLRVLTNVLVIPLVLAACGVTVTSFMMMNLYNDKQLVEEVDNINVIVPALIGMIVIGLGIMLVLQVSASRKGPTICVLASMLFFAVLGAYYGNICINGAALYDPHMDVVNGEMTDSFICSDVLGRMCDDNLRLLGCVEKFQPVEDCPPKAQLVESWDGEGLMCLNTDCCQVVRNSVKSGFIFVGLQSYALLGMTLLVAVVAFATFPDFNKYEVREDACDMIVIVSICILGILLIGFGIYFLVIYQGEPYPGDAQMSGKVIDAGYVDPYLLTPTIFWRSTKFSELSFEDSKTCDSCYT